MNKVILIGNVGQDPEVRTLDNKVKTARLTLATNESYKTKEGEKKTLTEWHNVTVWRGLAEVVEKYVKKGDKLMIEGKLRTRSYDDKDGVKRYITEIVTEGMEMLSVKKGGSSADVPPEIPKQGAAEVGDDLPF